MQSSTWSDYLTLLISHSQWWVTLLLLQPKQTTLEQVYLFTAFFPMWFHLMIKTQRHLLTSVNWWMKAAYSLLKHKTWSIIQQNFTAKWQLSESLPELSVNCKLGSFQSHWYIFTKSRPRYKPADKVCTTWSQWRIFPFRFYTTGCISLLLSFYDW